MNLSKVGRVIVKSAKIAKVQLIKHAPQIMMFSGIGIGVIGVVKSNKAAIKTNDILKEHNENLEELQDIQAMVEVQFQDSPEKESMMKDSKKNIQELYKHTTIEVIKTYAPSIGLLVLSSGLMIGSHAILSNRYTTALGALTALQSQFKQYRKNIINEYGEKGDHIGNNIKEISLTENDEQKTVNTIEEDYQPSLFTRFFDESNYNYTRDPGQNRFFLEQQMRFWNDKLRADGFVFLNDIFKDLGYPVVKLGYEFGWIYDPEDPSKSNFIDFGITDIRKEGVRDFINCYEPSILLDFNVDGNISSEVLKRGLMSIQ